MQSVASGARALHGAAPVQVAVRDTATGNVTELQGLHTVGDALLPKPHVGVSPQASTMSQVSGRSGVLHPSAPATAWEDAFAHPSPGKTAPPPPRAYATLQSPPGTTAVDSFFKEKPTVSALLVDDSVELAPGVEVREGRRRATAKPRPKSEKNMTRAEFNHMASTLAASTGGVSTAERLRSRGGGSGGGRRGAPSLSSPKAAAPSVTNAQPDAHTGMSTASVESKTAPDAASPPSSVAAGGGGAAALVADGSTGIKQPRSARQGRRAAGTQPPTSSSVASLSGAQRSDSGSRTLPKPAARPTSTADPMTRAAAVGQGRRLPRDRSPVRTATMQRTIEREMLEAALAQGEDAQRIRAAAAHRVAGLEAKVKASGVANPRRLGDTPPMDMAAAAAQPHRRRSKLRSGVPIVSAEALERRPHAMAPQAGQVSRLGGTAGSSALASAGASTLLRGATPNVYGEEHLRKSNTGRLSSTPTAQVALGL